MNKIQHPSNNAVLGAPEGWNQAELPCEALAITRSEYAGMPVVKSYWRPSAEELAILNAGGSVELAVLGHTMPPVMVSVDPL
ncbi:hypothetical protein GJ699_02525 [Duganella sp. FT80W]|uniref:Uncharacterized protein n=1 Tax=Duganella guangzhouensis TaxID=2666084 RepID=A0A6I2KSZ3_9BURK|nr:hypothetical protein [Duganella guangzhouensis]MRW88853.1 hypothetical protein [Duganella guangzhouensis]